MKYIIRASGIMRYFLANYAPKIPNYANGAAFLGTNFNVSID